VLAILHSAQYLWITSYYAKREATAGNETGKPGGWRPLVYFAVLVVGGIALFVPGPWLVSRVLRQDFTTSFLAFTALVNIHHFLLDGAIWKLRDGRIASLLLNVKQTVSSANASSGFGGVPGWLMSAGTPARFARLAGIVVLLLIAGLDQAKFFFGAQASDAKSLRRAQQLNPYDAALQLKLARVSDREGNYRANRTALEEAVRMNPNYRPALAAYAKLLIETREYEQAYSHYKQMFTRVQPDVDSLVNFGLLAAQMGRDDEAIGAWQRAIALDDSQAGAQLYLAEAFTRKRQFREAIPHYQNYLTLIASRTASVQTAGPVAQPEVVINAILKLAAAYQNTNDSQQAGRFYSQAATLADNTGDREALVFSLVHAAQMKAKSGEHGEAFKDFRRALTIENSVNELARPTDWVIYGRFLRQVNASRQNVFACFLKAQALLQASTTPLDSEIPDLRRVIENELNSAKSGLDSASIEASRANLNQAVTEALSLKL
jgi:tetratricopeptide (TPR) repeat protein